MFRRYCLTLAEEQIIKGTARAVKCVSGLAMSEKLGLQWNDFKDNINTAFGDLRGDSDFTDVTLAFEEGQQCSECCGNVVWMSEHFQKVAALWRIITIRALGRASKVCRKYFANMQMLKFAVGRV